MAPLSTVPSSTSILRETQLIKTHLDGILRFMEPHWKWCNCHMVNYFIDDLWTKYVPESLRSEIRSVDDISKCIEAVFWSRNSSKSDVEAGGEKSFHEFHKFLDQTQQYTLINFNDILKTVDEVNDSIVSKGNGVIHKNSHDVLNISEFLTAKKQHEVEIFGNLVDNVINMVCDSPKDTVIVDAGSGKGYLSSRLVLEYKYRVLGIDSNTLNTERALQRGQKLQKAWKILKERATTTTTNNKVTPNDEMENRRETTVISQFYRTSSHFITSELDLKRELFENFPELLDDSVVVYDGCASNPLEICLTGLHTCGNLSATCLRTFHNQKECSILCNVGCCYHLLKEVYLPQDIFENDRMMESQEYGFPLSNYLLEKGIHLGRNARMLASQSLERVRAAKELPKSSLHYRAILEILLHEQSKHSSPHIIGKVRRQCSHFSEYIEEIAKKHPAIQLISPDKIEEIGQMYKNQQKYLELFYLLRMTFAPILEALILLDRLLYLRENGYDCSYLLRLFDAIISPRCYAIIAIKNK